MTRLTVACCVLLLVVGGRVSAEQIGGPSGPADGEWRVGTEANFRDNLDGLAVWVGGKDAEALKLSTHTFYGVVQYGISDRLSIRGKAGVGKVGLDATDFRPVITDDFADFGYGLAWSAGLQYRICAPDEHGTSLALSGQFARVEPDDLILPGDTFVNPRLEEITAALTIGTTNGNTRPYAGVVWSDLQFDFTPVPELWRFEKDENIGAVLGLDQAFCDRGWLNLEARLWDEASFSAQAGVSW